jgi:Zn/Cd-binding protein ZinT
VLQLKKIQKSKPISAGYAKHAEVTVPSLADWEKEWQKTATQRATKVAAGEFQPAPINLN